MHVRIDKWQHNHLVSKASKREGIVKGMIIAFLKPLLAIVYIFERF